jgi:protein Mpv17
MRGVKKLLGMYERALQEAPLRTKMLTSGTILTSADVSRQLLFEEPVNQIDSQGAPQPTRTYDVERTGRMALFGLTIHPIWVSGWFNFMDKWQGALPVGASSGTALGIGVRKMLIDQSTSSPVFVASFIASMAFLQGFDLQQIQEKIAQDWWTTVKGAWSFWSIGHVVNFAFVPLHWRVLYINVLSVAWGMFLSKIQAKPLDSDEKVWTPVDEVFSTVKTVMGVDFDQPEAAIGLIGAAWMGLVVHSASMLGACWGAFGISLSLGISDSLQRHSEEHSARE